MEKNLNEEKEKLNKENVAVIANAEDDVPCLASCRWTLAAVGCLGAICQFAMRVNISIAIVCMVKDPIHKHNSHINETVLGISSISGNNHTVGTYINLNQSTSQADHTLGTGEFEWTRPDQGYVLSAYYWGYIVTQIPGGWLAGRFGGRWVAFTSTLILVVLTMLTPLAAKGGLLLLIAVQMAKGLASGPYFPTIQAMLGQWAPPLEKSKLFTIAGSGMSLGIMLSFSISGLLCEQTEFAGGWPSIFYTYGLFSILFLVLWGFLVYSTPGEHPKISKAERRYIEKATGHVDVEKKDHKVPWKSLLTSKPVFAIVMGLVSEQWGLYATISVIPQYMDDVLKFDIAQNGFYNTLPFLCQWIGILISGQIVDFVRSKGIRTGIVRKVTQMLAYIPPAIILIWISYLTHKEAALAVILFCVAAFFTSCGNPGVQTNMLDIAPRYAGLIMGLSNTVGGLTGITVPLVTGAITQNGTQEEWRTVFFISAGVYMFGAIIFAVFSSGEEQEWAKSKTDYFHDKIISTSDFIPQSVEKNINKSEKSLPDIA